MKTYDELLAENEALAAKLSMVIAAWNGYDYDAINAEINKTPQQCLAEIKAEAVLSFAAYIDNTGEIAGYDCAFLIDEASEYAAKIRNAGAWLKDSNVNGGKRQGGAE